MIQPMSYGYPYGVKLDPKTLEEMQEKRNRMYVHVFYTVQTIHFTIVCTKLYVKLLINDNSTNFLNSVIYEFSY